MRYQGKISSWKDEQGFGFITPNAGGKPVFVHIKSFSNHKRRPELGEIVTYGISTDAKGRLSAANARFADGRTASINSNWSDNLLLIVAFLFLMMLFLAVLFRLLPSFVFGLSTFLSIFTFAVYAMDKSAARKGMWRTQEDTLHLFALFGGWPGALIAQKLLRHKSKKLSFQLIFWMTVIVNCAALGWLCTASGKQFISHLVFN